MPEKIVPACERAAALVRSHLSPDLLTASYRARWSPANPTYGFCSVAAEAVYFLLGGAPMGWKACIGRDAAGTHWWLENEAGQRVDPTCDQYRLTGRPPPYQNARPGGFMGIRTDPGSPWGFDRRPSRRARLLLSRILEDEGVDLASARAIAAWTMQWRGGKASPSRRPRP